MLRMVRDRELYEEVILKACAATRRYLWIGTADIKDMHMEIGGRFRPFLQLLDQLVQRGVEIRLLHAKEPGERFRRDFDRYPALFESERFERVLCPRVHFKCIVVDGRLAYIGSANLTGAGMGARSVRRRNFEAGIWTDEAALVTAMMEQFEAVFLGQHCARCGLRAVCPDPVV
ncbi:MAG: phospholipase [Leptospirales bacterium]|nr:phospholipase [Leptospirales bacterium]